MPNKKRSKIVRCGNCKQYKDYPLFKVPLGPVQYTPDPIAASYGFDVKDGFTTYSWFCLECTRMWAGNLTEEYLRDGTVVTEEEEKDE